MEQITINDLPVEMIECILDKIDGCENRRAGRLVCRVWLELLDRVDSRDCININKNASGSSESDKIEYFSELVPLFLTFRRQKIGINFSSINLANTEEFWIHKGASFSALFFDEAYLPISVFTNMVKYCVRLKHVQFGEIKNISAQSLLTEISQLNITNNCVKSIIIPLESCNKTADIRAKRVRIILQQISKTFPRLKFVKLYLRTHDIVDLLIPHLTQFRFKIILKDTLSWFVPSKFVFNLSRDFPFRVINDVIWMRHSGYDNWNVRSYQDLFTFLSKNPLLKKLVILEAPPILEDNEDIKVFDTYPKTYLLKLLHIQFDYDEQPGLCRPTIYFSPTFIASFPNLKNLKLYGVQFKTFKLICEFMPHLEKLEIYNCINNCEVDMYDREDFHLSMLRNLKHLFIPMVFVVIQKEIILSNLEILKILSCDCEYKGYLINVDYERMSLPKLKDFSVDYQKRSISNELLPRGSEGERNNCFIEVLKKVLSLYPKMEYFTISEYLYNGIKLTCEELEPIFDMYRSNLHTIVLNLHRYQNPYMKRNFFCC